MPKRIYVGNLPKGTSEAEVRSLFARHGRVTSVSISGTTAYVEMSNDTQADSAISKLQNVRLGRNSLNVNEARPRKP